MHNCVLIALFLATPCLILGFTLFFRKVYITQSLFRSGLINAVTLLTTLALIALAAESYFSYNIASDGFGLSLAQRRWDELYSGPRNSLGYRDHEPPLKDPSKHLIVALGDSFTYGHGIKAIEDRYQNQLALRLGNDWVFATVAACGWDTVQEFDALKRFPRKPDILILQYYINDIQGAALANGIDLVPSPRLLGFPVGPLIRHSYFADFVYWRILGSLNDMSVRFWSQLKDSYADDSIWRDHEKAIRAFCDYTREEKIPTLVVIFPNPKAVDSSAVITQKVARAFRACGLNVLDLTPVLSGRSARELCCNPYDGHPNEAVHHEVSVLLYEKLRELQWIPLPK